MSSSSHHHDEYSSDDEEIYDSSSKSKVFLGFVDGPITPEDQPTIEDTFIGSQPVWLHPDSKPQEMLLVCDHCGRKLALLAQAYAPLPDKFYDRVLYLFGCKSAQCSTKKGSVKAIRGINKSRETVDRIKGELAASQLDEKLKLDPELTKNLFTSGGGGSGGGSKNPFGGGNPFASSGSNPFHVEKKEEEKPAEAKNEKSGNKSYAEIAASSPSKSKSNSKPAKKLDGALPEFAGQFVYVEPEKFRKDKTADAELEKYKHLIEKSNQDDNDNDNDNDEHGASSSRRGSQSSAVLDPQTTKISNMLDDKFFESFSSITKHNPGQVLRYDLGGKPLLYNGKDDVAKRFLAHPANIPRPAYNPSSERRFEFQLMPKAIMDLEELDHDGVDIKDILNGMSWGTIIVCTDLKDYIPDDHFDDNGVGYIQEWCGVQWEESV
ncbi:uncharacterized protein LODBEIA_P60610 [Lodderomyces beijingensis]|uniref:Programmed cell death protein 2 C-terminal domain-containing protein n=1 Tax=Lodderomyces beijingensis TaxID=1775926 RepID=A0ABP0ZX40_9ASCO